MIAYGVERKMYAVTKKADLEFSTYALAMGILQLLDYLDEREYAPACWWIAQKYNECVHYDVDIVCAMWSVNGRDVKRKEVEVLHCLEWNLNITTLCIVVPYVPNSALESVIRSYISKMERRAYTIDDFAKLCDKTR
jgi:hypothetical protein